MTLLSRRNRRTTVRQITPPTLAVSAALVLMLGVAPSIAQQPGQPRYQPGYQPGAVPLPPGYQQTSSPRPQVQQPQRTTSAPASPKPSGGTVMQFQKPADAIIATGGPSSPTGDVAQLNYPTRMPVAGVPDARPSTLPPLPPPPPESRYLPPAPPVDIPPTIPSASAAFSLQPEMQPKTGGETSTSKKQSPIPTVPEQYIKLPARENIFVVYNIDQLERAIMERLVLDRIEELEKRRMELLADKKDTTDVDRDLKELNALKDKDPTVNPAYRFPALPVVSPPGVAYQPKTVSYPPRQAILEPGYVVHRRLYFEELNAERQGWDLGPMQTLVSAGYFWRDTLLLPHNIAKNCIYGLWDTSSGKCLPGSPSPYYLYPPGLTLSGTAAEGVAVVGLAFIFP